jgi:hypothetical protein
MLEDRMSVWPVIEPLGPELATSEGPLVSVSIEVDARHLERLLEALAQLPFPINPEIYHDATVVYRYAGGREETRDTTLVEFPAYSSWLAEVRRALESRGFDPSSAQVTGMLEEILEETGGGQQPQAIPPQTHRRIRRRSVAA